MKFDKKKARQIIRKAFFTEAVFLALVWIYPIIALSHLGLPETILVLFLSFCFVKIPTAANSRTFSMVRNSEEPTKEEAEAIATCFKKLKMKAPRTVIYRKYSLANAFVLRYRCRSFLLITQSLLDFLSPQETIAVLCHEAAHLKCGDIWVPHFLSFALANALFGTLLLAVKYFEWSVSGVFFFLGFIGLLFLFLFYVGRASKCYEKAAEIRADLLSALWYGNIQPMISALEKFEKEYHSNMDQYRIETMCSLLVEGKNEP